MQNKCKELWQPNYSDSKSAARGYVWRCFRCRGIRKTTPANMLAPKVQGA